MPAVGLRERKKRELKQELAQVGLQLFTKRGFDATTIDDIVEPLGVSRRTFFRYFETKEDVVFAWYEQLTGELVAALSARPKDEAPYAAVCATLRSLLRYYDDDPTAALALLRLSAETPSLVGKSYEKRAIWERELATQLQTRLPKSATRELRARVIVGAAMAAFTQGVAEWAASAGRGDLGALVDKAFAYAGELTR